MPLLSLHCDYKPKFTGQVWNFTGKDPNTVDKKS